MRRVDKNSEHASVLNLPCVLVFSPNSQLKGFLLHRQQKTGKGAHEKSRLPLRGFVFQNVDTWEEVWVGFCVEGAEGMKAPAVKQVKSEVEGRISGISISVVVQAHCSRGWS